MNKKIFNVLFTALILLFFVTSCQKAEVIEDSLSFETELLANLKDVNFTQDAMSISIAKEGNYRFELEKGIMSFLFIDDDPKTLSKTEGRIVCKGDGLSFAKCVKGYVDGGHKVMIYLKNDEYVAEIVG